ncbi:ribonuclease H-like domain-containing protein [Rhizophagus clarus]|uniref:Ribonuclease H-like domain-containing protein n=1 Tax=Rhizophagus clarus TaxID=94130 RepID=A0A8H3L9E6_9GLOM|nr:ribonuclease H-like domain-containing protein [Rhizophagus clarus]
MFNFRNSNIQNFQQKPTPASTSRDVGQFHISDAELSHDSYENTNDICLDTSFGSQRRPFEPKTKSDNGKMQGGRPKAEIWNYFQSGRLGSTGHYRAKCCYCSNEWAKGEPIKLETHLGFEYAKWLFKNDEPLPVAEQNSLDSTTGDFLADQVSSIVEKTGVEKFAAFVTDSGTDFSKNSIVASFISELNKVIEFFNRSHAANKELEEGLRNMKISGGGLQTYVKSRWGFLFNSIDSILRARPVFDWIIREKPEIITSIQVKNQLKNNEFFSMGQTVARIMEPIKDCILKLEARTATLAGCYIQMLKSADRLPSSNTLRSAIIGIYNHRYQEFDHEAYLLSYYLHPSYRVCRGKYGQALGYGENMSHHLLTQLRQFKRNDHPFKLDYDPKSETPLSWWLTFEEAEDMPLVSLAIKMFSITPSEAGCERNFSVLKWYYDDRGTRLDLKRIESMSMMRSFWMTNIKKEMAYYVKTLTADDLRDCTRISTVIDENDEYEFDDDDTPENPESPDCALESTFV